MTATRKLIELDPTLQVHDEGEWSGSHTMYSAFNDAGVECETGEFLYSLVRLLKPNNVLETGTHVGIGASYIGLGLKDNGFGHLDTFELIPELHQQAVARLVKMGLFTSDMNSIVEPYLQDVGQFSARVKYGLILLDTEPQTRFNELLKFYDSLAEGGFLFIHDLHRHMAQVGQNPDHPEPFWPWGPIPKEMKQLVKSGKLRPFHFDTPRGLTGFYKVSEADYEWN